MVLFLASDEAAYMTGQAVEELTEEVVTPLTAHRFIGVDRASRRRGCPDGAESTRLSESIGDDECRADGHADRRVCPTGASPSRTREGPARRPPRRSQRPPRSRSLAVTSSSGSGPSPRSLDPMNANAPAVRHIMAMYDTLIVQSNDFKYHTALAESWEVSPDGTAYTFKLKQGVKFHDGTPFNAQAVKHNLDRFVLPEATANVSVSLAGVYKTTEIVDDYTARITLEHPFAPFLDGIAEGYNSFASPTAVEKFGKDYGRNSVGTGPFIFEEWKANSAITMKRDPDYTWGSSFYKHQNQSYLDKVSIRLIPEIGTRLATLETGEVHVEEDIPPEEVERLKKDANIQVVPQNYPGGPAVLEMNTTNPPLDDLVVRQAICWAVNQEDLVKNLFGGMTTPWPHPPLAWDFRLRGDRRHGLQARSRRNRSSFSSNRAGRLGRRGSASRTARRSRSASTTCRTTRRCCGPPS